MRMFITSSNRYSQKDLIFLENGKTGFFSFLRMGEAVSMLKVYYQFHIETGWLFKPAIAQCAVLAEQTHKATEIPIQWQSVSF